MIRSKWFMIGAVLLIGGKVLAQEPNKQMVRLAKLVIDSTQLEKYNVLLKEEIEASIKLEPGVLTLYAVAEKKKPSHITILEIYASDEAYKKTYPDTTLFEI